jgi:hypothetical protein
MWFPGFRLPHLPDGGARGRGGLLPPDSDGSLDVRERSSLGRGGVSIPILETWKRSPESSLSMRWHEDKVQWTLFVRSSSKDDLEFGGRVTQALAHENDPKVEWMREDAIIVRAMDSMPGTPFADFLLEFAAMQAKRKAELEKIGL